MEETEEDRRASFVDSLLNADGSSSTVPTYVTDNTPREKFQQSHIEENENSAVAVVNPVIESKLLHLSFGFTVKKKFVSDFRLKNKSSQILLSSFLSFFIFVSCVYCILFFFFVVSYFSLHRRRKG